MAKERCYTWDCPFCSEIILSECKSKLKKSAYTHLVAEEGILPDKAENLVDTDDFVFYKSKEEARNNEGKN